MPSTIIGLAIALVAILPGSLYVWAYERQASAYGVTLADRTLRFLAVSVIFHIVLGWPEYVLYRFAVTTEGLGVGQFAVGWVGITLLVAVPSVTGTILGGLYSTRGTRTGWSSIRKYLTAERERLLLRLMLGKAPAPRAWDDLFSEQPVAYLRVRTVTGDWLAGLFSSRSYAGGFPHEADLLLEEAWRVADDGGVLEVPLGYPVYIPASQIGWVEVIPEQPEPRSEEGADATQ